MTNSSTETRWFCIKLWVVFWERSSKYWSVSFVERHSLTSLNGFGSHWNAEAFDEWEEVVEDGVDKISASVDIASIEGVDTLKMIE